jgi:long-subunit acyl-CoA synthetase (AMP-forming)
MVELKDRAGIQSYSNFLLGADNHPLLESAQQAVQPSDILCLMFTSGTIDYGYMTMA